MNGGKIVRRISDGAVMAALSCLVVAANRFQKWDNRRRQRATPPGQDS